MVGPLGWMEITIIIVLALLVVGPKGLPKLGRSIGKALRDFKREANELKEAVELEVDEDDRREEARKKKARTRSKAQKKPSESASGAAADDKNSSQNT